MWVSLVAVFILVMYVSLAVVIDESTFEITDCILSMGVVALAWWVDSVFVSAMRLLSN